MKKIDNLEKIYKLCVNTGKLNEKTVDIELIKSIKLISEKRLEFIKRNSENILKESSDWTFIFTDYYEALRNLIEAYILFDGISAENHQCKNAYICFKHPELEFNWEFLEMIRLLRNQINYEGRFLNYEHWAKIKLEFELHINTLKKEIDKKLKE